MTRRADRAILWYELAGYFRGSLPFRFIPLIPAGIFLAAWTWRIASPFAAVIWIVFIGLEPRINNMFYGSVRELEALSLFPSEWKRIIIMKNGSTALVGVCALVLVSAVCLYFSPEAVTVRQIENAVLYLMTICFPVLSLGNEASSRYPRRDAGAFSGGLYDPLWMSLTLLAVSVPYFIITELVEIPWLGLIYSAATAASWYFRSVARTAVQITNRRNVLWMKTGTSSNS